MTKAIIERLGPLAPLAGIWEGDKGDDTAPDDDRTGVERNLFRERLTLEPFGPVNNHEQEMFGLRYSTVAWRIGALDAFHEEVGYWLWEPATSTVLRCFLVPRGVSVIAGGKVEAHAKSFSLSAELGSRTFGICSNPFLDREFQTVRYDLTVTINGPGSFTYEEDTQLCIKNQAQIFHHRDRNTLTRID